MVTPNVARNLLVVITAASASASESSKTTTSLTFAYSMRSVRATYGSLASGDFRFVEPRLRDVPEYVETAASDGAFEGFEIPSYGTLVLDNTDGALDAWDTFLWRGSTVAVYDLDEDADEVELSGYEPAIRCTAESCRVSRGLAELSLRDVRWGFAADLLLTETYRGHQHQPRLDGSSQYGSTGASTITPTAELTWEGWFTVHAVPSGTCGVLVHSSAFVAATTDVAIELKTDMTIRAVCYNSGGGTVATPYVALPGRLGDPVHIAARVAMAGGTMTVSLLFDAVVAATNSGAATRTLAALPLYVGAAPGPLGYAPICFSALRLWNVARTDSEIAATMRARLIGDETGLVQQWPADAGSGAAVPNDVSTGVAIALTGSPSWVSAAEGAADLAGQPIPRGLGFVENVRCQSVDPLRFIYRILRGPLGDAGALGGFRTNGSPYAVDTAGDYDNRDSFVRATVASGKYVTCLRHGLVKFGTEPQGEVTADVLGEQFDATVLSTRHSVRLNGTSQYGSATVSWAAGSWTMGSWVCLRGAPAAYARVAYSKPAGNGTRTIRFPATPSATANTAIAAVLNDAGTTYNAIGTTNLIQNRWYHIMASFDASAQRLRLYVDGVLEATTTTAGSYTVAPSTTVTFGSSGVSNYLQADLARMFVVPDVALAPADVTLFANPFNGTVYRNGYLWIAGEGSGTSVADYSAHGAAMTLTGSPSWAPGPAPDFAAPWLERVLPLSVYAADLVVSIPQDRQSFLDLPPHRLGRAFSDAGDSVATLVDDVLRSLGACLLSPQEAYRFCRPGYAFVAGRSTEEVEAAGSAVDRWEIQSFDPNDSREPVATVALSYRPIWFVQSGDALFSTVTSANRDLWSKDRRVHEETDGRLLGLLGSSVPKHEVSTILVDRTAAIAEARRRLLLYGRVRRYSTLVVFGERPSPGDAVDLSDYDDRFDLAASPIVRVVSATTLLRSSKTTCSVFRA